MDGWITIGAKLDSKQLQRDLIKSENELKKYDKQAQKLVEQEAKIKTKIELDDQDYKRKIKDLNRRLSEEYAKNTKNGYIVNQDQIDLKYNRLRENLDNAQIKRQYQNNLHLEEVHQKMQENTKEQERLNNKIQETESLLNKAKGSFDLKGTIENIGNSITKVTKKVVRWGLAIFGVRSAYYFVRQAMSTLSQYDDQLATDIQYIRFALAMALKPLIEEIIKLAYKLLNFIAYVIKLFTGKNIFENSGIDKFKEYMDKSSKSAKELKKTIAGFDEMNILNDNSSGGSLGTNLPSYNLNDIGGEEDAKGIQKWLKKVEKMFRSTFKKIRENVVKVMKELGFSQDYIDAFNLTVDGIEDIFGGLGLFIKGFGETVVGLLTGDIKLVKKGFEDMGKGIKLTFKGLLEMLGGIFMQIVYLARDSFRKLPEIIYELFIKKGNKSFEEFKVETKLKFRNIVDSIGKFFGELPSIIISALNPLNFVSAFNKFTNAWNDMIRGLTKDIKINISSAGGGSGSWGGGSGGGGFRGAKGAMYYPKLAVGGIINMPGRGVPYHGATIGERGAEAVIPLTDSQQMALLGEAIGKYITVNATIVNSMNGRVLNRELQKIQNQTSFATNGR